ncbi:hypothetical protein SOCE26_072380 [Sorangium cellulosum]|uniref:Glycosyltransferase RgtA/B/C/D-like domain-containing protein n=1 Tax=Sorangium cellulosum TaxID=56 RepID=A0A2L0F2F5_SORCE|nr:hypothetical protein [Sorangium cellulosum]AUX45742.1 hypothetical protein SOCE26_072380 [Sorangium cellulosum]
MSGDAFAGARRRDAVAVFAVALAARIAVVAWAAGRFPPTADGTYYQRIAERIAAGLGYTWLWPDGVVTYAAHYPVGYPGAVGALYALVGAHPAGAMLLNAVLGALAALAVHQLAARAAPRSRSVPALSGALVAIHPGLVAYTPALMTEGVTGALVACAAWASAWARDRRPALAPFAVIGLLVGVATLVRPQTLVLAPAFAVLALSGPPPGGALPSQDGATRRARAMRGAASILLTLIVALLVCAPWTARNCARMNQCALVSVNGGWNLLIGADPASTGAWAPIQVPAACRDVFDEAGKDTCFGREARRFIAQHPGTWLGLVPRKLAATFDYCGAAGWYLHASNPAAFREADKVALGAVETLFERVVLLLALVWAARAAPARAPGALGVPERRAPRASLAPRALAVARLALLAVGVIAALHVHAWVGYVALLALASLQGRALLRAPVLAGAALAVLAATALTHAVFFGAGRYALVAFPLLSGLAGLAAARQSSDPPRAGAPPGAGGAVFAPPRDPRDERL